jgi:UDP-N-acetylmuramate: L-alanyl-gamma-D-glutamyl-meso-diaminopimelate ligase
LWFNFDMKQHLHILGICGTAMAAIAALAKDAGWRVTGSDSGVYPPMSDYLAALDIGIAPFDPANLEPAPDLCVIGNAMSRGNCEVETILNRGLSYCSGPEFIGHYILPGRHAVVVAGTHGKTTTSSLLAHVLEQAGEQPGFLIGGVPEDFGGGARLGRGAPFVLEGDEYDTAFFDKRSKFLHYRARTLILNNLEYDHADIFPDLDAIKTQFHHLIRTVPAGGAIIVNADDANLADVLARGCWTPQLRFARRGGAAAEWQWEALAEDGSAFQLFRNGKQLMQLEWSMIGQHHVANACAVAAAATRLGVEAEQIRQALASFSGIRRRMTLVGEAGGIRVLDDFAHHPTAIAGIVDAAKASMQRRGSGGKLRVVIEPRSNTMRTRTHQQRLPDCFTAADEVLFVPASARNLRPAERLDIDAVCAAIGAHAHCLPDSAAIIAHLCRHAAAGDEILILSNGGFDNIHRRLLAALHELSEAQISLADS